MVDRHSPNEPSHELPPALTREELSDMNEGRELEPVVINTPRAMTAYRGSQPPPSEPRPTIVVPVSPGARPYIARMNQVFEGKPKPFVDPMWRVVLRMLGLS